MDSIKRAVAWLAQHPFESGDTLCDDGKPLDLAYEIVGREALSLQIRVKDGTKRRYFTIKVTEHV